MLFGKHKARIIIEIPVDKSQEKEFLTKKTLKEITPIYICIKDYTNLHTI